MGPRVPAENGAAGDAGAEARGDAVAEGCGDRILLDVDVAVVGEPELGVEAAGPEAEEPALDRDGGGNSEGKGARREHEGVIASALRR